jgi:two-component system, cell cycle response regulator
VRAVATTSPDGQETSDSEVSAVVPCPLKVLVVEDDDAARQALEKSVRLLGYACRSARDGLEAWEMHQQEHADVILSDWQMARMDGVELCRRTRVNAKEGAYTYFIFMTSFGDKEHFLRGMEAGADDYHTKPVDLDELRARLASAGRVVALYRKLAEKNAVLRRDSQSSFRVARIDALTQVSNRLSMDEDLRVLFSRTKRYRHRYSIAIGDIDRFKSYNDHFGHLAGDEVLRRVAQTIRDELREGDGLYRYGGEEFVVILPEQSLAEAARAMERVRLAVEHLGITTNGGDRVVTISFGVAELDLPRDGTPEDWLRRADAALYRAKSSGRNRVEAASPPPS